MTGLSLRNVGFVGSIDQGLYPFTTVTFTSNSIEGRTGPDLANARTGAGNPDWASTYLNMTTNGIQEWTVPKDGLYQLIAAGAKGGGSAGGQGAILQLNVSLTKGQVLNIVVGQIGLDGAGAGAGGGGGSFVYSGSIAGNGLILVAGGGGGQDDGGTAGASANSTLNPGLDGTSGGQTNNGGNGTGAYEDGQGWLGTISANNFEGRRYQGTTLQINNNTTAGGFGGGGDSTDDGGGAGGFTGGSSTSGAGGGNGGSYYAGLSVSGGYDSTWSSLVSGYQFNGTNSDSGYVTITKL